jgi:DNA mismatch repair protein MutL
MAVLECHKPWSAHANNVGTGRGAKKMPIRILPPIIASKIAAGEVVERPASVVKELLENAIDADARDVRVEIRQGGRRLIRVSDDGSGIAHDEAPTAFEHHATSKIASEADLSNIRTLGFRGEALASIAAVAQVSLLTRTADDRAGTWLQIDGGEIRQYERRGSRPGSVITVENLFFNTPARLKFLRTEATEGSLIVKMVSAYALSFPELRFTLVDDGRLSLQTLGTGNLYDVLVKVYGLDTAQQMLELQDSSSHGAQGSAESPPPAGRNVGPVIGGYVGAPSLHRATRSHQMLFVNRRWIADRSLSYAVEEAYRTLMPTGRYPVAVVSIAIEPAEVDVNVHPTKREVRFREPRAVFAAVQRVVRHTIVGQAPVAPMLSRPTAVSAGRWPPPRLAGGQPILSIEGMTKGQLALELQRTAGSIPLPGSSTPMLERLPMLRVLGQIRQMYIIAEGPDGLYLIDQHAAHERILYEQLKREQQSMSVTAQTLLEPVTLDVPPQQSRVLEPLLDTLAGAGFDIAPFGSNTYLVRAAPASLGRDAIPQVIGELLDQLSEGLPADKSSEQALVTIVCHSAVRAGQTLTLDESRELVKLLEQTATPCTCPHGRPTMIHLSSSQLERSFGRA